MHILIFKHIYDEPAGHAEQWALDRGHTFCYHYWDHQHLLTKLPEFDLLIIMGGMMGAYEDETYPWLTLEKQLIREAIDTERKVVGICLGAQLIAAALGARVYKNSHPEIGFHSISIITGQNPVFSEFQQEESVFQWHGDTFDLPEGACLIATSENVKNQAFTYKDHVLALQFHPEMDAGIVEGLLDRSYKNEVDSPWKQEIDSIYDQIYQVVRGKEILYQLLDKFSRPN